MLKNDHYTGRDFIGNADVDYKVHGFEDLRFHATAGADVSSGEQDTDVAPTSPLNFYFGSTGFKRLLKRNLLFNAYTQYYHDFKDKLQNHVDIMAGYEWQHFWRKETSRYFSYYPSTNTVHPGAINSDSGQDYDGDGVKEPHRYLTENYLVSFFAVPTGTSCSAIISLPRCVPTVLHASENTGPLSHPLLLLGV